jgi:tRNA dimethylallyltransferase
MNFDGTLLKRCRFLAGPTAVGKSALSLELAEAIGGEIVSLDSMTIYRRMDIGTAKPDAAARARVPHHLLDLVEPYEEYSLAEYVRAAERVCREVVGRGHVPLFVGGTGLYLKGILRGVFEGPSADWEIRKRWEDFVAREGVAALHTQLALIDPPLAERLHPHDVRRVVRGLEVYEITGLRLSDQQRQAARPEAERPLQVVWLEPPRDWLYARIDERVRQMFQAGLVAEVEQLLASTPSLSHTARQALGYREVIDHLQSRTPLEETILLIQTRTRQFAKRQHTWFRNLEECQPLRISGEENVTEVVARLAFPSTCRPE